MEDSSTDSSGDEVRWRRPAQPSRRQAGLSSSSDDADALDSEGVTDSSGQESNTDIQLNASSTSRGTRCMHRLQARVKQLERAMEEAGLQVPPPESVVAVEEPVVEQRTGEIPAVHPPGKKKCKSAKQRLAAKHRDRAALGGLGGNVKRIQREEMRQCLLQLAELRRELYFRHGDLV